jgi:hypothetical protein
MRSEFAVHVRSKSCLPHHRRLQRLRKGSVTLSLVSPQKIAMRDDRLLADATSV